MLKKLKKNWLGVLLAMNLVLIIVLISLRICDRPNRYSAKSDAYREDCAYEDSGMWYAEEAAEEEAPMEAEMDYASNGMSKEISREDMGAGVEVDMEAVKNGEKLVYTANIALETKEYQDHKAKISGIIKENGVIVENMSEDTYNTQRHASYTLRVPCEKYEAVYEALCSAEEGWNVLSASSSVENMTKQYSKLTAQIEAYEQERETLMTLLKDAENVSETLEIQDRLAWLNSDLQYYYNERENIDADVAMSTIYLDVQELKPYKPAEYPEYTFGERVKMAFEDGLDAFVEFWQDIALFFVENWMFLGVIAVLIAAVIVCVKRSAKHRRKKAEQTEVKEEIPEKTAE